MSGPVPTQNDDIPHNHEGGRILMGVLIALLLCVLVFWADVSFGDLDWAEDVGDTR